MSEQEESGLSIKEFCANAGFHANSYYYWQRKLREAASNQLPKMQIEHTETFLIPQGFTEIKLSEPATQPEVACPSQLSIGGHFKTSKGLHRKPPPKQSSGTGRKDPYKSTPVFIF